MCIRDRAYYENGVRAAMRQFAQFPNGTALYNQYLTQAVYHFKDYFLTQQFLSLIHI